MDDTKEFSFDVIANNCAMDKVRLHLFRLARDEYKGYAYAVSDLYLLYNQPYKGGHDPLV